MNDFFELIVMFASVMAFIPEITCTGNEKSGLYEYCIETVKYEVEATPIKIIPEKINTTFSAPSNVSTPSMELSLCPNNKFLKVHVMVNRIEGNDVILCYRKRISEGSVSMTTNCYRIYLIENHMPAVLDCWFPIILQSDEPVIQAWTETVTGDQLNKHGDQLNKHFGSLDPNQLDHNLSCTDACEMASVNIISPVICHEQSTIVFDKNVVVHHLAFDAREHEQCSHVPLTIDNRTDIGLGYSIDCDIDGTGHIKVLYAVSTKYCLKYQEVKITCQTVSTHEEYMARLDEAHSFGVFVLFGLGCMTIISIIIAAGIFTFQKLQPLWNRVCRQSADLCIELDERETGEQLLSHHRANRVEKRAPEVNIAHTPVVEVIKKAYIKRMDSFTPETQSLSKQAKPTNIAKTRNIGKLHKSVTLALLENTDELYRKRVLILPRPYDSFSRDATNLLKTVFTLEGGIPSQCCFDRDIYQQYITGDKYQWVEQTLADRNKILIFLCFTSIPVDIKCNSMVADILDHLLLTRIKPHQFCKVVFLHITDNSDNLAKLHHGESFHIKHAHSYGKCIENILSYCGKNQDTESAFIQQLIDCDASRHFLKFVGVKPLKSS